MKQRSYSWKGWIGLFGLITLACQLATPREIIPTAEPLSTPMKDYIPIDPPPTPIIHSDVDLPTVPTAVPAGAITNIETLQAATVQILAKVQDGGRSVTAWHGSGTIISPDGLIVTNAHVAAPTSPGLAVLYNDPELLFADTPSRLVIAMETRSDQPPQEAFVAELLAADGTLDLAILRIVTDVNNNPVDTNSLNLPYISLGNSNLVRLGDEIRILGFPGAGGETITFTRGDVSGFESQDRVGDRAWIKTDATFSPGNSGGLAVNSAGQLIGVPSFILEAQGGAINRLRAINYVHPLVDAAIAGIPYDSPYVVNGTGSEQFQFVTWADDYDSTGCATTPTSRYDTSALAVVAIFQYKGLTDGEQLLELWYHNDELIATYIYGWDAGERGDCFPIYLHNFGETMSSGTYKVELFAGGDLDLMNEVTVAVGRSGTVAGSSSSSPPTGSGVSVEGTIRDAGTGNPIANASVFILYPDADIDEWLDDPVEDEIFTFAETDEHGNYQLADSLPRNKSYPGVVWATGYLPSDGYLDISQTDPATVIVDVELDR